MINEIISHINIPAIGGGLLLFSIVLEKTELKIKPWSLIWKGLSWVLNKMGQAMTKTVMEDVQGINKKLECTISERIDALQCEEAVREKDIINLIESMREAEEKRENLILERMEQYREEGLVRDRRAKLDSQRLFILDMVDKINVRGLKVSVEMREELNRYVHAYEKGCAEDADYVNAKCIEACEFVHTWYKESKYGANI